MTRALIALSVLSAALYADANAQTAPRQEGPFSEFVYEALGATPSLQFAKRPDKAVTSKGSDAARVVEATGMPETTAAASAPRDREVRRASDSPRSAQESNRGLVAD